MTNKTRDENDRAVDGTLPDDPEADAEVIDEPPPPSPIATHWKTLADAGIDFTKPPQARRWLLKIGNDGPGALPLGKAGVLAAGGGTGKTMALVQLALAVATGGFWLGTFKVESPGNVLLALAEEEVEEVHRRFYRAAQAVGMSPEQRAEAAKRIVALPLAGNPVALTEKDKNGNTTETKALAELRERLAGGDWRLVVLDPFARWAGDDAEIDNAAATRFVQAVESLVRSPGNPTVLVAHHSSKTSKESGQANVRGASAIEDGFRWAATLDAAAGDDVEGVRLRLKKSNYTERWGDVYLVKPEEHRGAFVRATDEQREKMSKGTTDVDDEVRLTNARARMTSAEAKAEDAKRKAAREARLAAKGGKKPAPSIDNPVVDDLIRGKR